MIRKLDGNRQHLYRMDDATFSKTEKRWLMEPKDADIVDNAWSNRDVGPAFHGQTAAKCKVLGSISITIPLMDAY